MSYGGVNCEMPICMGSRLLCRSSVISGCNASRNGAVATFSRWQFRRGERTQIRPLFWVVSVLTTWLKFAPLGRKPNRNCRPLPWISRGEGEEDHQKHFSPTEQRRTQVRINWLGKIPQRTSIPQHYKLWKTLFTNRTTKTKVHRTQLGKVPQVTINPSAL